ncbi:CPBP family intramembrane glutamic endopeptidase [Staphylococcus intermedius]|uniref:Metal-dependent membrane protease n=3 Tax=Staphylococcus intermedius TaxID=1285 RepID=A0A380G8X2_STAIN|nr:type II CAAX endopeptidase family protein [Staphylococcus intermedius]PCF65501.1 CPBP family intramembrane metalloprotease [Staphylococcus intermedius]PCF81179.1 CPBP family intramembrane metalloprotease [Staphylococcus intermedius]PCF82461.1 CPBP family intramembrane metalloprotease [Staphylococcus intermedius]PCF87161.1 CPBP family intramembrane metalloprotease [Staphylococcus intermedius]PCF87720.1 CPBP family intramembrane metalloprotease [Staphylococcus intermedius]
MNMSSKQVAWRDLWAIVIYFLAQIIIGNVFSLFLIPYTHISVSMSLLLVGILTSVFVILYLAWSHRHGLKTKIIGAISQSKKHIKLMISIYVIYMLANMIFTYALQFSPEAWQFKETGNQEALMVFFHQPAWLPLVFLSLAILTPITEELLFRHIIIGELGKKWGVLFTGLISIVIFASLHMFAAHHPLEIVPYIFLATMFVVAYIKSGCNIAVSIFLHMFNNSLAFVGVLFQIFS